MALRIETPRVCLPLLQPARYKGHHGGRGSTKSHTFAVNLLEHCAMYPGTRAVCVREVQRTLEQSVMRLLDDKIQLYGLRGFRVMDNQILTPGNGRIGFEGMQNHNADSIKSLEGYDIAWFEEAQTCSQRSLDLLTPTIRKDGSELWFSWNPRFPTDPIDQFFRGPVPPPSSIVVKSTYHDNPFLPKVLKAEAEWMQRRDPEKYAHIWLGEYETHSEARVFKNWRVEPFDTPANARFYFGADWGFSVDPTVLVRCWIVGRTLYIDQEAYQVGCEIDHTAALFDSLEQGQARRWPIVADSARPETISYMQRHGYPNIKQARKGAGSVEDGIAFLQSYDIVIHPRCVHTADEFASYRYQTDKLTGDVLPKLEDDHNHVIDAVRYALESVRLRTGSAFAHIQGL